MSVRSLVAAALVAVAVTGTPAASQERASDDMTPEQARMMEAYTRAGTPGEDQVRFLV